MVGRDGLAQDVGVHFNHVWPVATDGADVTTFPPAFRTGQELGGEKRVQTRRAEENGIGAANMVFEHAVVFAVLGAQDAEAEFFVGGPEVGPLGSGVNFVHQIEGARRGPIYDVDMMDLGATEDEREADVPRSLLARAKHGDFVHVLSATEDEGCREGGAECGEFFSSEEGVRCA